MVKKTPDLTSSRPKAQPVVTKVTKVEKVVSKAPEIAVSKAPEIADNKAPEIADNEAPKIADNEDISKPSITDP